MAYNFLLMEISNSTYSFVKELAKAIRNTWIKMQAFRTESTWDVDNFIFARKWMFTWNTQIVIGFVPDSWDSQKILSVLNEKWIVHDWNGDEAFAISFIIK